MAGDYTAHVLLTSDNAGAVDWIARGATLTLGLGRDGTTSGHLFVPGGGDGGSDLDADMAGGVLLLVGQVRFGQTAHTIVRNMDFVPSQDRLSGHALFPHRSPGQDVA